MHYFGPGDDYDYNSGRGVLYDAVYLIWKI